MDAKLVRKYMSYPDYFRYSMTVRWYRLEDKIVLVFKDYII